MKYTKEQFKKITDGDEYICFDDLPFDKQGLEFFNALPEHIQGMAVQWGTNDTGFRDELFEYMIDNQFGMTVKQYYGTTISKHKYGENIPIDYSLLPGIVEEIFNEIDHLNSIVILNKEYEGYESFFDFDSDMSEVLVFDNKKIPNEFNGIIKVTVEYFPSKEDKEIIKKS